MIDKFEGKYRFLSNFWPCPIIMDGILYKSTEAAFQAAKTLDNNERNKIAQMNAGEAKKAGKKLKLRDNWETIKYNIMYELVLLKFSSNPELKQLLLNTGDEELIEGNWWGDTYWGICNGIGENNLGKILMQVRGEIS